MSDDVIDLFKYKIKDVNKFYHRNHPEETHPDSPRYTAYWNDFFKKSVEGVWVDDNGTWVFLPPKLFFYINYTIIADASREDVHPSLRDNEWIIFSYILCYDGFSGFELDEDYTCLESVRTYEEDPNELDEIQLSKIPYSARKGKGFKKYINAWEYLTSWYLLDNPATKPLGLPLYENRRYNGLILTARSIGKDNRWDTVVYKEEGPCVIKDIKVGDYIYGADGKLTKVIDRADYNNQMQYKITFGDGRVTYCGDGHLWEVYKIGGKKDECYVMPVKQIRKYLLGYERNEGGAGIVGKRDSKYFIKICDAIQFPEKDLPIDPYFLGLWLGDGTSSAPHISTIDDEIKSYVYKIANDWGLMVSTAKRKVGNDNYELLRISGDGGKGSNTLLNKMKDLELINNKHIPPEYLYASEDQRMELVRGLLDTDGHCCDKGQIEFVQKNKRLTDEFCKILGSLGIKYRRTEKLLRYFNRKKLDEPWVYQRVYLSTGKPVFKLKRKLNSILVDVASKSAYRKRNFTPIRSIEAVGVEPSVCIALDNESKLFVCDDYIVTHNSLSIFLGDFFHEFTFSGIKREADRSNANKRLLFTMASAMKPQLQRSINNVKASYFSQPGKYRFTESGKADVMGAFYKKVQGKWEVGGELSHLVKSKSNAIDLQGSSVQMVALTADRYSVGAGDRFRRIYIEEVGFLKNVLDVHSANKDSLQSEGVPVGSAVYLGCVCAGSKVHINSGEMINIESIKMSDGIIGYSSHSKKAEAQTIGYLNPPQNKDCYRITTNAGRRIECSHDHPIFVRKRFPGGTKAMRKSAQWYPADEIIVGDGLGIVESIDVWGKEEMFDPRLIGWLIGDGSYREGGNVRLNGADDEVWDYVNSKYSVYPEYAAPTKDGRVLRKGYIRDIIPEIEKLGMRGQVSVHKDVPEIVFKCTKDVVCEMLGGYFDADGCCSINKNGDYPTIKCSSISINLIRNIQLLLNKLGIHGRIVYSGIGKNTYGQNHPLYDIVIKDKYSIINFHKNISFKIGYKQNNLNEAVKIAKGKVDMTFRNKKFEGLRWEKVVEVVAIGSQPVYNLRAEGTHTYIVNGIHTHNTSGDLETVKEAKHMFNNTGGYDIFGIPNYWGNTAKKCGLFLPKEYALKDYKDENGNTKLKLAREFILKERDKNFEEMDSVSYETDIMFNPINPDEMLRPGRNAILPKQEAQNQLNMLESYDVFKYRAQIGKISWDGTSDRGVSWKKDLLGIMNPILELKIDDTKTFANKDGAIIIYEQPPEIIPDGLFWVIYDPAAKSGDGESFHSVLVYKHFYVGKEQTMYDTIVAEWIGRKENLDDNFEEVIKLAKYFNAKIFPEINVAGFVEYCRRLNYWNMLESDAYQLEMEIHGNNAIKRSYYKVGFMMNKRKKNWALKKLRDWLGGIKEIDPITQAPITRTMDWILSPRILNEIIAYTDDPKENFDHISSLLGLMLLLGKLDGRDPVELDGDDNDYHLMGNNDFGRIVTKKRCEFLEY